MMSASLIGRLGSSTFRLSITAVSMSLTGSRFSSESAPRPLYGAFFVKEIWQGALFFFASFFVRSEGRFFVPIRTSLESARAGAVKVGRRANLARHTPPFPGHTLTASSTTAPLGAVRTMTIRGGARLRARINRATTLYSVGPRTRTMMQSCASAAKLRSGGPILPFGMKAKGPLGIPPPRTVIGVPSQAYGQGRNCRGTFSVLRSLCRTENNAVRDNAHPHEPPQGDQQRARQGHDHGLSSTASVLGAGSIPL